MIFTILLVILVVCIVVVHALYIPLLRKVSAKTSTRNDIKEFTNIKEPGLPTVSIIVPVHNEEKVIERRLNNIFESSYPHDRLEIIVVDSGSVDNTSNIIDTKFGDEVKLIEESQRKGKAHAINLALSECKGDIVILTDAPTLYEKKTILSIVTTFQDPLVGGVTVLFDIINKNENQITSLEATQWSYKNKIRIVESNAYSTSWLSGEACAFRRGIIDRVDEDTLADDSNIALQIISKGYRVIVNDDSVFMEKSPSKLNDYLKVKIRKALGGVQETLRFKQFFFNRKYSIFGLVIFPHRFFVEIVNPILSIIMVALIILSIIELNSTIGPFITMVLILFVIVFAFLDQGKLITYVYVQFVLVVSVILMLSKKLDVNWYQSKTTRA